MDLKYFWLHLDNSTDLLGGSPALLLDLPDIASWCWNKEKLKLLHKTFQINDQLHFVWQQFTIYYHNTSTF